MRKESKKKTDKLAELYAEADDLLAAMEGSAIAGLKAEMERSAMAASKLGIKKE